MGVEQMARLLAEMKADIRTSRAKTDVDLKEMKAKMDSNQKDLRACLSISYQHKYNIKKEEQWTVNQH